MVLFLLRVISLLGLVTAVYHEQWSSKSTDINKCIITNQVLTPEVHVSYKWLVIPGFMSGLSTFLILVSAIEFIWAQAPYSMTGLAFGTMYTFLGLNTFFQLAVAYPFLFSKKVLWKRLSLTCGIWYFLLQGILVLIFMIMGVIIFNKYKRRTRSCLLYTSPSPRDLSTSRMPSSA